MALRGHSKRITTLYQGWLAAVQHKFVKRARNSKAKKCMTNENAKKCKARKCKSKDMHKKRNN